MKTKLIFSAVALAALLPAAAPANAQGFLPADTHVTAGLRVWHTRWETWFDIPNDANLPIIIYPQAGIEYSLIPVLSVRSGNFFVSGSYLAERKFRFDSVLGVNSFERKEYDVNIGYFIIPGLAATVGWKHLGYEGTGGNNYDWDAKGPTVGLSGNAAITPAVSVYGNLAYGWPKLDDNGVAFRDKRGNYLLTEFGLAFPLGQLNSSMGGFVVTAGYRYQRVAAESNTGLNTRGTRLFEYTQGPVLGASYTF